VRLAGLIAWMGRRMKPPLLRPALAATQRPNFCAGVEVVGPLVIN